MGYVPQFPAAESRCCKNSFPQSLPLLARPDEPGSTNAPPTSRVEEMAEAADKESSRFPWCIEERPARLFSMADGQEGARTALAVIPDRPTPCE